jgi:hypothetical protein
MGTVGTHAINASLYPRMPYDHVKDFAPITLCAGVPNVLVLNPAFAQKQRIESVADLIKAAKANPGRFNVASSGNGTSIHLSAELFKAMTGTSCCTCRTVARAPRLIDLMGGNCDLMFDNLPSALPHIKAGKLKALAVTSAVRSAAVPRATDHRRSGRADAQGLRGVVVVRTAGARRCAGRRDRPRAAGGGQVIGQRGGQGAAGVSGRDPRRHHTPGVRALHRCRDEEMGAGGESVGRQGGLMMSVRAAPAWQAQPIHTTGLRAPIQVS